MGSTAHWAYPLPDGQVFCTRPLCTAGRTKLRGREKAVYYNCGCGCGYNNNGWGGWGNGEGSWIFLLFILLAFGGGFGFGGRGFGFGGGYGYGNSPDIQGIATRADINEGFAFNNMDRNIRGVQQGLCDGFYALNNSVMNGFHGVDNAVCTLDYQTQQGFNTLGAQLASCCCDLGNAIRSTGCDTQRAIDGVNYNIATQFCATQNIMNNNTRDVIQNQHNDTDRVIAKLNEMETNRLQDKLAAAMAENQTLKFKASQAEQNAFITANQSAQTAELIRRLGADCPVNAVVVQPPTPVTFPTNCCGGVNFANSGNCGNSCGCNHCGC